MRLPRPHRTSPVRLVHLVEPSAAALDPGTVDVGPVQVTGITHDSRAVRPGDLYAALPGHHAHGAQFAAQARLAGAPGVLTDREGAALIRGSDRAVPLLVSPHPRAVLGQLAAVVYGHPAAQLRTVGITGTNGKTTVAYLLDAALQSLGEPTGLIGTVETRIGEQRWQSARTTPEATDLHALLAAMVEAGTRTLVMEVSSHALVQHRVDGVVFDLALFTNLSQDHLDFHGSMERYFSAKADLFTPARARQGLVCVDDGWGRRLAKEATIPVRTLVTRADRPGDWRVTSGPGSQFFLAGPRGALDLRSHLPGAFNVGNTALAAGALFELGYPASTVAAALAAEPVVPGRMERVPSGPGEPRCIVDYAHTPDAVDAALAALRPSTPGRLVAVLGAGGDRDQGKRRAMGAAAARWADDLVVTDDNPRSEDPEAIRAEVLAGARETATAPGRRSACHCSGEGRAAAIALAVDLARCDGCAEANTVVVLGKGHETGQEQGGLVHPFDDREALAAALRHEPYRPTDVGTRG